jgi:hypothetical protein
MMGVSTDHLRQVEDAARRLGFNSLWDLAKQFPDVSYGDLVTSLGVSVTAMQLEQMLRSESIRQNDLALFARDCLSRYLHERLPEGWKGGPRADFKAAHAFGSWCGALGAACEYSAETVWRRLTGSPDLQEGWLPSGPDDPVLLGAFRGVEFPLDSRGRDST